MTELEIEVVKLVREQLIVAETRTYEHVTTTFRWLMATLFAANGGALIALMGSKEFVVPANRFPLGWFAGGLLLSILMGVLSSFWGFRAPMRNEQVLTDLTAQKPNWKTWIPSYAGGFVPLLNPRDPDLRMPVVVRSSIRDRSECLSHRGFWNPGRLATRNAS